MIAADWKEGLPIGTEDCVSDTCGGADRKRWTRTVWTQDDTTVTNGNPFPYILNPRVTESKVGDTTNTKRTTVSYHPQFGLVNEVKVYDTNQTTELKKSVTTYNLASAYTSRRIIGLPSQSEFYGSDGTALSLMSKVTYSYDEGDFTDTTLSRNIAPVRHDDTNYGASFIVGRGNLTSTTRHDVIIGETAAITSTVKYNTAGAAVAQTTPGRATGTTRTVKIGYADVFNDGQNRNTFAYPTKLTDPAGNFSEVKYRFDIGANIWAKSPMPQGSIVTPNLKGKETERIFDSIGRLEREKIINNGAYTRYEYPTNSVQSKVFATITDGAGEAESESWTDGAGRVRRSKAEHPGSAGGWSGSLVEYDILGRVRRSSVPTEINLNYEPAGDDYVRGFLWTQAEYDWKGRVTHEINTDGTDKIYTYEGCGCAGGQITTIQSESVPRDDQPTINARRTQKIYADILGRSYKTEIMNWDGTTPYTTTVLSFNGRDQVIKNRQYAGGVNSATFQDSTATFDGHGRLATEHRPEMNQSSSIIYDYQTDDSLLNKWDARGAKTTFGYDNRGLLTSVSSLPPQSSGIQATPPTTFGYDAAGNRTWMQDGMGRVDYEYNELSQVSAETRTFNSNFTDAPPSTGGFRFSYSYKLDGSLKDVTYPNQIALNYITDKTGKLKSIAGTSEGQPLSVVTNVDSLAWGGIKRIDFGNGNYSQMTYNNRLLPDTEKYTGKKRVDGDYNSFEMRTLVDNQYSYNSDGSMKLIEDKSFLNNMPYNYYDRLQKYDHVGRVVAERSGREALQTAQIGDFIKYDYNFSYDAFGNLKTEQSGKAYNSAGGTGQLSSSQTKNYNYQNNRVIGGFVSPVEIYGDVQLPAWQYDNDGRPIVSYDTGGLTSTYDTSGYLIKQQSGYDGQGGIVQDFWYDGDGNLIKTKDADTKVEHTNGTSYTYTVTSIRYVINSSVLGEAIVYQDNQDSRYPTAVNKETKTQIYGMGNKIAVQNIQEGVANVPNGIVKTIDFKYETAFEAKRVRSEFSTETSSGVAQVTSISSRGLDAGAVTPNPPGRGNSDGKARFDEDFREWLTGEGCSLDGVIAPCRLISKLGGKHSGAYALVPTADVCRLPFGKGNTRLLLFHLHSVTAVVNLPRKPAKTISETGETENRNGRSQR